MKQYLQQQIQAALASMDVTVPTAEIVLEKPKIRDHGDLATAVAMTLARSLKRNPREIAQRIMDSLDLDERRITAVEIAGPGFLNFRFSDAYLHETVETILARAHRYGAVENAHGKTVNVEWVSANPTGPLHAGHGRQVCIGATVCELLEWTGWTVTREYYFNLSLIHISEPTRPY